MKTRSTPDFSRRRRPPQNEDAPLYDLAFDAVLIEQSLATQYGILPDAQGDLPWPEWSKLVSGLMDDTPLGRVVAIRAEDDRDRIAKMTPWQRSIRRGWQQFQARKQMRTRSPAELRSEMAALERSLAKIFGGGNHA